jgi:hypothetical protein
MRLPRRRGITTADALVLCGGVSVLALFVALWLRGIPEQARYARCLSHLRLLGRAMELYRQDYATTARPASMDEMGLPPNLLVLAQAKRPTGEPYLPEGLTALRCPDEKSPVPLGCSYGYNTWTAAAEKRGLDRFRNAVAQRGRRYPLVYDHYHDPPPDRPPSTRVVLVLRLDGTVEACRAPLYSNSWKW